MDMSLIDDPLSEFLLCRPLDQRSLDHMKAMGVPVLALISAADGTGHCIRQDRVEARDGRLEFARYVNHEMVRDALVALAFDRDGRAADIVAWRTGHEPFVASWLGRCALLGEDHLDMPRLGEPLRVHADVLNWLRADRRDVVVVNQVRAAPMLRDAVTLSVASWQEKRWLADMLAVKLPSIVVDGVVHRQAAE